MALNHSALNAALRPGLNAIFNAGFSDWRGLYGTAGEIDPVEDTPVRALSDRLQAAFDAGNPSPQYLAKIVIGHLRATKNEVFEAAGVNPEHRRDDFVAVVDQIIRSL
ncbi:MAG: hypothetical protein H8E94_09485 [Alphaproteobacteria bacterium]|nr:hypothetical protein [Alphaproteobacteria bacterium]